MNFLVIHERGNWSAIRQARTIEEAKNELLKMVQEATVEWGDVFRISKGTKSRAAAKHLQEHGSFGHEQRSTQLECRPRGWARP
jgi:hypothetical protein